MPTGCFDAIGIPRTSTAGVQKTCLTCLRRAEARRSMDRGIVATLAEPTFREAIVKAREAALKQNLFTLRDVIDQYRADRGKYPASLAELKDAGYLRRMPLDPF